MPQGRTGRFRRRSAQVRELPAFVPDGDAEPPPVVADLRRRPAAADAVVFSTREYAGSLPGSLENALDRVVGSGELHRKPVAWIAVGAPGRGAGAEAALATVLGCVDAAVVASACGRVIVRRDQVARTAWWTTRRSGPASWRGSPRSSGT